eukprot:c24784_g1_i1 orf=442-4905(-)
MMLGSRCPEEVASPSLSRNQVTRIQGTSDYLPNRSSNHSQNNQFYFAPNSNNMFPQYPNANNSGLDVRLHSANGKAPCQNVLQAPRQEFLSYGFSENQLPWQGSVQGPGEQQLGGIGSGVGFPDVRSLQQQQQSSHFQQEPHEVHWQFFEQQHGPELDHSRQQNMQQVAHVEFPETSYSALLHRPDTPPSQPESAWDTSVPGMENCGAAEGFSWSLKSVTGTHELPSDSCVEGEQGFLYGRRVGPAPSGTQGFLPEQLKAPSNMCPEVPELQTSNLEDGEVKNQVMLNPVGGSNIQQSGEHFTERDQVSRSLYQMNHQQGFHDSGLSQQRFLDQKWDGQKQSSSLLLEGKNGSLASTGQSYMQLQQRVMNTDLERQDVNCSQFQSRDGLAEESSFKQQEGPTGATPNGIDLQQYNPWNAPQTHSMNGAYGNHLQPPADAGYNTWGMGSWQEGHHFMQHTSGLSYDSGNMQMGPNHAQYGWGTQSAATMADGFSQFYPEGYYSSGSSHVASFGGVGENDMALPSPFESYGHYQGSQVYHPPANQFVPGVGMPVNGTGCNSNWNNFSGPQDIASQKNHERLVHAGGQVQPRQLQSNRIKGPHIGQPTNNFPKSRQEKTSKDGSADKETSFHEKDVELEGPQAKKQREFSEVNVGGYNLRSSSKSTPQPRPGSSSNLPVNSREDGASSRRNISHVQDMESKFHSSGSVENDHNVQALSHGSGFESGMDRQGHTSEETFRVYQRSDTPSNFSPSSTRDITRAQVTTSFVSGQMMSRDHTRSGASTSAVCENGTGLPRREFIPGVRFVPSAEQLQEHSTNNEYFPRGPHTGFKEDLFSTGRNPNEKGYDRSSISVSQDQPLVDTLMRQLGDGAEAAQITPVGWENVSSETGMSSYAVTQELPESQCNVMKPSNVGGGPGSISMSSMRNQDVKDEHNVYCNPGHDYASSVDGGEYVIPNLHPEGQEQRTSYPLGGVHPSHLKQFAYLKAMPSETTAQLRGFSRSALGKFHPPPPFQSHHPVHLQRENGRPTDTCFEEQTPSEAWAPRIFESAVLAGGKKEMVPKPVNYQANSGFMGKGPFYFPATGESVATTKSMFFSESEGMQQRGLSSSEAGSVSKQQPEDTYYAHSQPPGQILANNIGRGIHSRSMTVESQGSARPFYRLRDNEQLKALQPSAFCEPMASGRNLVELMQVGGEQHQLGHYTGHHTFGEEYSAFKDGVSTITGKFVSERLSQHQLLASKPNLRVPTTLHPKKRKKPVPYLIPWHIVATQPRGQLPSISKAELMWASAANRIPEKDGGEVPNIGIYRAASRLRLTTQLMQQLLSPLPSVLMHGNQPVNLECGVYNLAKSALGEACRLMAGTEREIEPAQKDTDIKAMASHGPKRMWNLAKEVGLVERFMEKVKRLDFERARLDCSMSMLELKSKNHDLEKSLIVHRLGKYYGTDFLIEFSESKLLESITNCGPGIRRLPPQKYVIAVPMPRTLPEGVRCLSL